MRHIGRWIAGNLRTPVRAARRRARRSWRGVRHHHRLLQHPGVLFLSSVTLLVGLVLFWPGGCTPPFGSTSLAVSDRMIRVRLLLSQDRAVLTASESPTCFTDTDPSPRRLELSRGSAITVSLAPGGWIIGGTRVGSGVLTIRPASDGSVAVNGQAYRGIYCFVPVSPGRFDVVNHVDLDAYLQGVVAKEMLADWHIEAYKAQAVVARTYALYEMHLVPRDSRTWDVYADTRSQVYGGVAGETRKSRQAVADTAGVVVAYGPPGRERIFHAYFSSCCGGVTQSVTDSFGESYIPPLGDQDVHGLCSASPKFNWGPIVIRKDELTRRFRRWGAARARPEQSMAPVRRIEVEARNRFGRPVRFTVIAGTSPNDEVRYSWNGEELRRAVNTEAAEGTTVYSSFVNVISDSDVIRFVDGHGWGHGTGMCQWCAQTRAQAGMNYQDIVVAAFPRSTLVRAY